MADRKAYTRTALTKNQVLTPTQLNAQIRTLGRVLDTQVLAFITDLSVYARKTFRMSFQGKKFRSANSQKWQEWSEFTRKKRTNKHTLTGGILREYGTLMDSIIINTIQSTIPHIHHKRVFTNPKLFNKKSNPHPGFCYAGIHNNPGPGETYGNNFGRGNAKRVVQRQFMGHSTYIESYAAKHMNSFLFDGVFNGGITDQYILNHFSLEPTT